MAARAMWKGVIRFEDVSVPVKLYSAAEDRTVRFRLLHETDGIPVEQRMMNPESGRVVERSDVRRGFEIEKDRFVVLDPGELRELEPEPSREIRISRFVPGGTIGHQWYDRPYLLGPDGDPSGYAALVRALERRAREGIAHWVMRKKAYLGALRSVGGHLVLMTLRHAEEVISARELTPPAGRELSERERTMAERFISALEDELDLEAYENRYRDRVLQLVELKRRGETVELPEPSEEEEEAPEDLGDLLEESLARLG